MTDRTAIGDRDMSENRTAITATLKLSVDGRSPFHKAEFFFDVAGNIRDALTWDVIGTWTREVDA